MNKSIKLKGGQIAVQALSREKTKHVFGLIGSATMEIFDALYHERDIKFIMKKLENLSDYLFNVLNMNLNYSSLVFFFYLSENIQTNINYIYYIRLINILYIKCILLLYI